VTQPKPLGANQFRTRKLSPPVVGARQVRVRDLPTPPDVRKVALAAHAWLVLNEHTRGDFLEQRRNALQWLHTEQGMSLAEIADLIGVSKTRIAQIVKVRLADKDGRAG
jgi:hypothetical protein